MESSPTFVPRKILVATDFSATSELALQQAVWLAEKLPAELTVVHVLSDIRQAITDMPADARWQLVAGDMDKFEKMLRQKSEQRLTKLIAPFANRGVKINTVTLLGSPFVEVIHLVQQQGHDLVVAGARGTSTVKNVLVGSTAQRLLRDCPAPTWIVRRHTGASQEVQSIVAAVNFSPVAAVVLRTASALAAQLQAKLTVLHAFDNPLHEWTEVLQMSNDWPADPELAERHKAQHEAATAQLAALVAANVDQSVQAEQRIVEGSPWDVIAASTTAADLVVMASMGRTGIPGLLLGSTADRVMRMCERSILVVKPAGYVSPIEPPFWQLSGNAPDEPPGTP